MNIGSLPVKNTKLLFTEYSRMATLCYASPKRGKTTLSASLNDLTQKHMGKPTLYIAVELGEGGGLASVRDAGLDYVTPSTKRELDEILAYLPNDTKYGGVSLDGATEVTMGLLKPYALAMPSREKAEVITKAREVGVPAQSDYNTMGEDMRTIIQRLMNLTTLGDPQGGPQQKKMAENRKHLFLTALLKVKTDKDGDPIWTGPQLPGQMAENCAAIVQTVMTMNTVISRDPQTKQEQRSYHVSVQPKDKWLLGDRFNLLPNDRLLPANLCELYEQYWIPAIEASKPTVAT